MEDDFSEISSLLEDRHRMTHDYQTLKEEFPEFNPKYSNKKDSVSDRLINTIGEENAYSALGLFTAFYPSFADIENNLMKELQDPVTYGMVGLGLSIFYLSETMRLQPSESSKSFRGWNEKENLLENDSIEESGVVEFKNGYVSEFYLLPENKSMNLYERFEDLSDDFTIETHVQEDQFNTIIYQEKEPKLGMSGYHSEQYSNQA